jgi:Tfp pilus assembly protein PilF
MSLIIDALKRAQQLRINGSEGSPILRYTHPDKKRRKSFPKRGILIGMGLTCLCFLLIVLLKPVSLPFAIPTHRADIVLEKKPSALAAKKMSQEPPKEGLNVSMDPPILPHEETLPSTPLSSTNKGKGESLSKWIPEEEKTKPPKKMLTKKRLPSLPPVAQREETSPPLFGVEQEGKKKELPAPDILTYFNSGVSFYNQREFSKAIQDYQKVIELDPTYVEAYNNLGIIYQMVGDGKRAFDAYQKSTEINPRYEKGYNNLGILLLIKDRYEEALEAFQKALSVNSNNIESHINLGILFKKTGQWEKAIESYQRALAINPLHRETHYNMALLYEQMENLDLAIRHYQQFIQLSQKSHPELVSKVQRHLNTLIETKK